MPFVFVGRHTMRSKANAGGGYTTVTVALYVPAGVQRKAEIDEG
jgi:hypothetical protein